MAFNKSKIPDYQIAMVRRELVQMFHSILLKEKENICCFKMSLGTSLESIF